MASRTGAVLRLIAALCLGVSLAACNAPQPTVDRLKSDLETALASSAPMGLLTVQTTRLIESDKKEQLEERQDRALYFGAAIRVNRDHNFGAWDQFNAAALARAIGALPEDIVGLNLRSAAMGDVMTVKGRALYRHTGTTAPDGWQLLGFRAPEQDFTIPQDSLPNQLWNIAQQAWRSHVAWDTLKTNFAWTVTHMRAEIARQQGGFALATGPAGSDGWTVAEALRRSEEPRRPVITLATTDSVDALRLVRDGAATAAIVDSDTATMASAGIGAFASAGAFPSLRVLATLFPEPVHVIVAGDSKIASVADLRGKRIALSGPPAGTARAAEAVLRAHRLPFNTIAAATPMALKDALDALTTSRVDAVVAVTVAPQNTLADMAGTRPLRLLNLDSDAIALLTSGEARYLATIIPARTYAQQATPIATIAVTASLVSTLSVPNREAFALLESLYGPLDYLQEGSIVGTLISVANAQQNLPLPLHPGAEAFYRSFYAVK